MNPSPEAIERERRRLLHAQTRSMGLLRGSQHSYIGDLVSHPNVC
jgi:hypothetical protein